MLPSIEGFIEPKPGKKGKRDEQYIPMRDEEIFWTDFYLELQDHTPFDKPVPHLEDKINPYFGYFGFRFHPNTKQSGYFHTGISITEKPKRVVVPVCDGVLEYSGFDVVNGFYVFLAHPHIETADGYVMHSLYMHLKKPLVKFSSYQKMLREISFHKYPNIFVERGTPIGEVGSTGVPDGKHTHLHLQIEFRHPQKKSVVVVDPLRLFDLHSFKNRSALWNSDEDFEDTKRLRKNELKKLGIDGYFK